MRKILLFFCILFIQNNLSAQVTDIVQQTWYLRNIQLDGNWNYVPYGETMTLNFSGNNPDYAAITNGIENTFSANITFNADEITFYDNEVSSTDCTDPNCYFEDIYFYEYLSNQALEERTFTYFYFVFSNGRKIFRLIDANGNRAEFSDQPLEELDEGLFQKWYLHYMSYDLGEETYIGEYDPPIVPTITINPDLSYTGFGSCNEFSGKFDYSETSTNGSILISKDFLSTSENCEFHNDFEANYFAQFENDSTLYFQYWKDPNNGVEEFSFEVYPGFIFSFYNFPVLSVPDSEENTFLLYPNPSNNKLFIKAAETNFSISIFDTNGRKVLFEKQINSNEIDVSALKSGMYFITIESSEGKSTKKFIKN